MAESVVSFVVQRVGDLLVDEAVFLYNVPDEAEWVRRELGRMQCFLEDADAKRKRDKMVNKWVKDIRDAAYEAEDLVESFALHGHLLRGRGSFMDAARRFVCLPCALVTRHRFGEDFQSLKAKILEIADSRSRYGIQSLRADGGGDNTNRSAYVDETVQQRRRVALHADDSDVVGMEDAKQDILKQLFDDGVKRRAVVSIVGMGGLGKTTLAKKVYKTFTIQTGRFDCVAWFNISQQYRVMELLQELVKKVARVGAEAAGKMSREELEEKLYKSLEGRKYLIILDDVWDNNVWSILNAHLPDIDAANGSRVLITTRSIDVAKAADPGTEPYELRFLNEEESWELFSRKVFSQQDFRTACPAELQELGKQISKRCGGLPLALVVLGGMLSRKPKSAMVWGKLADTIGWQNSEEGQLCLEILALSYRDLPPHLKWCFLYLGSFPEDYEINVEKLTRLWIAEGFVVRREGETPEESADGYLEELIQRCLVQVVERSSFGGVDKCRIHDLLHDLSIAEAKEVDFFECHRNAELATRSSSVRRLSLHKGMEAYLSEGHPSTPNLRTLLGFNFSNPSMDLPVRGLKLLRVVDLEEAPLMILSDEIGDALHLRYLGLRKTRIKFLPASIGKLCHLQTLDVASTGITKVPNSLWRIKSLRHIFLPSRVQPLIAHGNLRDLHTLDRPNAGRWIDDGLASLTNLQTLSITNISESHNEGLSSSLEMLLRLRSLELEGTLIPPKVLALSTHQQLYILRLFGQLGKPSQPYTSSLLPSNLTQLTINRTKLDQDPLQLLEGLPELRVLILLKESYVGKEMVCSPGGFLRLEVLRMEYLEELEQWGVGDGAMVCLKSLSIRGCSKLEVLPQELQNMHALQELTIVNMNDDFNLRVRKGDGEDWPKIQHVPSISINNSRIH
ncbi:hypothetical protein Taro_051100 [Colocasia esculenta]|uniref:Uncharacterized protein n=1 Tax=Colocasia esculenta TaxID=4460 RepID=A0A843XFR7_COLES|nr:hypothetical protein [Colocasia esculenta]